MRSLLAVSAAFGTRRKALSSLEMHEPTDLNERRLAKTEANLSRIHWQSNAIQHGYGMVKVWLVSVGQPYLCASRNYPLRFVGVHALMAMSFRSERQQSCPSSWPGDTTTPDEAFRLKLERVA